MSALTVAKLVLNNTAASLQINAHLSFLLTRVQQGGKIADRWHEYDPCECRAEEFNVQSFNSSNANDPDIRAYTIGASNMSTSMHQACEMTCMGHIVGHG